MSQSILIIEDDVVVRASLVSWLEDAGFCTQGASSANEGMALFERNTPDLVLLDLGIGDADGMDLLRLMKKRHPGTPVIIVSGRTHITDAIEAFKAGAWDYVTKPIPSLEVFTNSLRNCLAQSQLQIRVQEAQEHLHDLIQNLPVIIFIINRDLEFEFLNQTTEQILGYAPRDIMDSPKSFLKCIASEDRGRFLDALKRSFEPGADPFRLEFRFLHQKGYQVFLQAQSIAHNPRTTDMADRVEGMIMDVTRHSYMDKILLQNEKLNMLRTMTEEVAHEIRNPLVSLGGFARKLRARFPEALETEIILEECTRLERLVQRINAYLEPIEVNLTGCSIPATLAFILRLLSSRLERLGITCAVRIPENMPHIHADQEFLHRIFMYLISQSAEIMDQTGRIDISAAQSNDLVHVTLSLSSVRVPLPSQDRLLMPFEGGENPNLATCYRLIERLHGHLHVEQSNGHALITLTFLKYQHKLPQSFIPI